jgi:peroxiredoxin Q/BCP
MTLARWAAGGAVVWVATATPAVAQQAQGPAVGQPAPDFALVAATSAGVGKAPVSLTDFKGKTVVLAFFYKARTKG